MLCKKSIFIVFALFGLGVRAQPVEKAGLDELAGKFVNYIRADTREKIIVITDKEFYAAGETMWFKAWCLDSLSNRFAYKSKNLLIDLVDDNDSVVTQLLFSIPGKNTDGKMVLPELLKEGYYWLRAYTTNILHEDSSRIFVKPVYVLNASMPDAHALSGNAAKSLPNQEDTTAPRLLFFPEGGALISGTTAVIAFRCVNSNGNPVDVSGFVTDSRSDTLTTFKTSLPGIGKFSFDAFSPRKYVAHIRWKKQDLPYPLPRINPFASQLSLVDQTDQVFHIRVSLGDSLYKTNKSTYILGVSKDSLCFAASGTDMYDVSVPKHSFPAGKSTLFLFDDQHRLLSQRTIYVTNPDTTKVAALSDKTAYEPREKVEIKIKIALPGYSRSLRSLLSVAITDDRFTGQGNLPSPDDDFILPASARQEPYSAEQMDLLMLTQKNRYPEWMYAQAINPAAKTPELDLCDIKGMVVNSKNDPLKGYIINLFSGDKTIFKIDTTDNNGHFHIALPDYQDGTPFTLKITNLKGIGQEGRVLLDKYDFPVFRTPSRLKKRFEQGETTAIRNFKLHKLEDTSFYARQNGLMRPVTVHGEKQPVVNYDVSKRVSQFSTIITSDKLIGGDINAIPNAIKNVPGFNTGVNTMVSANTTINGVTEPTIIAEGIQPLVVLDGVIISLSGDVNSFLQSLDPGNIDFIEVLKGPQAAIYGMQGSGGVILINTTDKRKQIAQVNDKGLSTIYARGYYKPIAFTMTDYDKKEIRKSSIPDHRSTLYWNPNVLTDTNGNANLDFFTADEVSSYSVTILGITENGDIISKKVRIKRE